jgi:DMSO/TMAO reductase YedYZ heme-binding membrane subunit
MYSLFRNIRFYFLSFSIALALVIYLDIQLTVPAGTSQITKLSQIYGLISIVYLYLALLATPLTKLFDLPFAQHYLKSRRAIGVSAFLFAFLHTLYAFFGELGGFPGLSFLSGKYLFSVTLGFIALIILSLMAGTSFDYMVAKLTFPKWKKLHRYIYLGALLVLIHTLMLGSHFISISEWIPQIFLVALVVLLSLEMFRFDGYLSHKFAFLPKLGISFTIFLIFLVIIFTLLYSPTGGLTASSPFNIHTVHIQLAQQAQQGQISPQLNQQLLNNPGLVGDRTRRFTVSLASSSAAIQPNQEVTFNFQVFDASSGSKINLYQRVYEKFAHLIVVDNELNFFNHIHPDQVSNGFQITTQFPHPGRYHLYLDFQPLGAIEQQFGFTVDVGSPTTPATAIQTPDQELSKYFGNYHVIMYFNKPLKATDLSIGNQKISFQILDASTHQPITTLKPYLAAFGHLVMINQSTYDYIHVHPTNLVAPQPNQNGGPDVEFLPLGLYGPIKPGIYRVFAQFNPDNNLFTADFTVKVEP